MIFRSYSLNDGCGNSSCSGQHVIKALHAEALVKQMKESKDIIISVYSTDATDDP